MDNKASHCAAQIAHYYRKYDQHKGTQFVFSDLGTWKPGDEWNVYAEIRRKLVEDHGIPASEVRFIQEAAGSEGKRKKMIEEMNTGRIRVLFGSTDMLGTGVNAQRRCVAIHHLDSPWRPSDLEQREGRGIRKGNEVAKLYADNTVDVIIYAVEKSLDAYKFGLLHNKQLFIRQLKHNNLGVRTIDEGGMDEGSGMNFSEYVAVLSGNTDLLEKARLEKKIAGLESERQAFIRGKSSSRSQLEHTLGEIEKLDDKIGRIEKDLEAFRSRAELNEDGSYRNRITLDGVESNDPQFIGKQLNHIAKTVDTGSGEKRIGSIYGFEIIVKSEKSMKEGFESIRNRFYVRGEGEYLYQYNYGNLAGDPRTAALNPLHALGTIEPTLEKFRKERTLLEKDVPQLRQIIEGTWRKEADLAALKKEMERLDRQIQLALKPVGSDRDGEEAGEQQEQRQEKDARREAPAADDLQRHIPARLRQIADASGGRIVIGGVPPRTDDDFHPKNQTINRKALHFILARLSRFIGYRGPDQAVYSLSEPSGGSPIVSSISPSGFLSRKFWPDTTLCPNSRSVSLRATPATLPPRRATRLLSANVSGFSCCEISVVTRSPSIVKISSKSVMWSRRFWPFFVSPLIALCSEGVTPNVARAISAVRIAKSLSSRMPRSFHSSVRFCRMAMPRSRLSIQSFG